MARFELLDVLESQLRSGTGPLDWRRIDGAADADTVLRRAAQAVASSRREKGAGRQGEAKSAIE